MECLNNDTKIGNLNWQNPALPKKAMSIVHGSPMHGRTFFLLGDKAHYPGIRTCPNILPFVGKLEPFERQVIILWFLEISDR